jgi:type IV pilus assembly protein PilE
MTLRIGRCPLSQLALPDTVSECECSSTKDAQTSVMKNLSLPLYAGFTLIETLISVMLIGILLSIALPSLEQQWLKTRRHAAQNNLFQIHLRQVQWRGMHVLYADNLLDLGPLNVASPHYNFSLDNVSAQSYSVHAQAKGTQARDTQCLVLSLRISSNGQLLKTSNASAMDDPQKCWP